MCKSLISQMSLECYVTYPWSPAGSWGLAELSLWASKGGKGIGKGQVEDSRDPGASLHSHYNSLFLKPLSPRKSEWGS